MWILPIGGVASVEGLYAACVVGLVFTWPYCIHTHTKAFFWILWFSRALTDIGTKWGCMYTYIFLFFKHIVTHIHTSISTAVITLIMLLFIIINVIMTRMMNLPQTVLLWLCWGSGRIFWRFRETGRRSRTRSKDVAPEAMAWRSPCWTSTWWRNFSWSDFPC